MASQEHEIVVRGLKMKYIVKGPYAAAGAVEKVSQAFEGVMTEVKDAPTDYDLIETQADDDTRDMFEGGDNATDPE
jgi:hypothetical protein